MIPKEFFTPESMLTLLGSVSATFIVCNGLQKALNFNPKWLGLVVAQLLALYGVIATTEHRFIDFGVGIINGFLIYCSAAGGTSATASVTQTGKDSGGTELVGGPSKQLRKSKRGFLSSWF